MARKWFGQAVQWMEKKQPRNEELRRFRAEAEGLLGINAKDAKDAKRKLSVASPQLSVTAGTSPPTED